MRASTGAGGTANRTGGLVGLGPEQAITAMNSGPLRTVRARHETRPSRNRCGFPRAIVSPMNRLACAAVLVGSLGTALAQPTTSPNAGKAAPPKVAPATLPVVGEALPINGAPGWPEKLDWMYDSPSFIDAAGKVVVHWFCAPRVAACVDDLARIVTLKENGRVYVIAYINGSKAQAKKLDPIRESEGVGRGTLAFGRHVAKMFKQMSVVGPASVVVDVDGKVAYVGTGSSPAELDARDAKVAALQSAIKEYTATSDAPKVAKPGEKFSLSISIKLASWLQYSKKTPMEFKLMAPKDIACDATTLKGDQLKVVDKTLTAKVMCSGPKGSYQVRATINFGYDTPGGGTGLGADGATWKFEIKP